MSFTYFFIAGILLIEGKKHYFVSICKEKNGIFFQTAILSNELRNELIIYLRTIKILHHLFIKENAFGLGKHKLT